MYLDQTFLEKKIFLEHLVVYVADGIAGNTSVAGTATITGAKQSWEQQRSPEYYCC